MVRVSNHSFIKYGVDKLWPLQRQFSLLFMKFDGNNDRQRRVGVSMLFDGVNMASKEGRDLCRVIVVVSLSSDDI
jgi:hypothetical protein